MWIIKEMGRWRFIGRFDSLQKYNSKRNEFVLSCPSQLRVLDDEKHFNKALQSMREPEWDHHKTIKKSCAL